MSNTNNLHHQKRLERKLKIEQHEQPPPPKKTRKEIKDWATRTTSTTKKELERESKIEQHEQPPPPKKTRKRKKQSNKARYSKRDCTFKQEKYILWYNFAFDELAVALLTFSIHLQENLPWNLKQESAHKRSGTGDGSSLLKNGNTDEMV